MAKPHKEIPSGMFVVSKGIKEKNQLNGWIKHFHEKGISTKIIRDSNGMYYLCREGLESRGGW
jgi:hypothetical protein